MANSADQLCFCAQLGKADAPGTGHFGVETDSVTNTAAKLVPLRSFAHLDTLCLEARLRRNLTGQAQVLVLFAPARAENEDPDARQAGHTLHDGASLPEFSPAGGATGGPDVVQLKICGQGCLTPAPLVTALKYGFDRIFLQLSDDLIEMAAQLKLVEQVTQQSGGTGPVMSLFHAPRTLTILLSEVGGDVGPVAQARPGPAEGCEPQQTGQGAPKLDLHSGQCTLCGHCAAVCPQDALALPQGEDVLLITDSACTGCGICVAACPTQALALLAPVDASVSNPSADAVERVQEG